MSLGSELNKALNAPVTSRAYVLEKGKIMQIAHLSARKILTFEGVDSVVDVLERNRKNHFEQKIVVPHGHCVNTVKVNEQYFLLEDDETTVTASTKRFNRTGFMNYISAIAEEDGPDSAADQIRERISNGKLVRLYRITDENGVWRKDREIRKFVRCLDILRVLMDQNIIGPSTRVVGDKVMVPFVPVYMLELYDELDMQEFAKAHKAREERRKFAKEYFALKGVDVDIWNDRIWDEKNMLLVKNASGQLVPAVTTDKKVRDGVETDVLEWADKLLTKPVEEYPYMEETTKQNLAHSMAEQNPWDRIKTFRCLYEQAIMAFKVSSKTIIELHPEEWRKYILFQEIVDRLPKMLLHYILYDMNLTDVQAFNLYHPDNIPHKYRRILAHRFGREKLERFLKHLFSTVMVATLKKFVSAKGDELSREQLQLLAEFVKQFKTDCDAIDLEEYCRQDAEKLKKESAGEEAVEEKPEPEQPAPKADEDATDEEKNDKTRGGNGAKEEEEDGTDELVRESLIKAGENIIRQNAKKQKEQKDKWKKKGSNNGRRNGQNGQKKPKSQSDQKKGNNKK